MDQEKKIENKIVETYADDMAKVLESDTGGLVKKIIHGEEEHEAEKRNFSPESQRNKIFMALGALFFGWNEGDSAGRSGSSVEPSFG